MQINIQKIKWLNSLSNELKVKLLNIAKYQEIKPNNYLALQDLPSTGITYFKEGSAVITMQTPNLKTINNMVFGAGNWFGDYQETHQNNFSFKISIWKPIEIIHFENSKLQYLVENSLETYSWLYHISLTSRPKWLQAQLLSSENKHIRIIYMLLELYAHQTQNSSMELAISQQALSEMIGISRQRVNEVLNDLQTEGYINLQRNSIQLLNLDGLAKQLNHVDLSFRDPSNYIK